MTKSEQSVADFTGAASFTSGLQEAIDALPKSGGVVWVPPGIYTLRRHVRLSSNVAICGSGPSSIIARTPEVSSSLLQEAKAGDTFVQVENAAKFEVGMEVSVFDVAQHGWYATHAFIADIDSNRIHLDRPVNRDCQPGRSGKVAHAFSAFLAWEEGGCELEGICIDGSASQSVFADFTVSAVHFVRTTDARITRCSVRRWPSDGISVQGGSAAIVSDCLAEGCLGHGFHPGTSVQHSLWTNNISRNNGRDGLYFCMYVRHSVVSGNSFYENGRHGIGGLGDGGDQYNVVANNSCVRNKRYGIEASRGQNNAINGNICLNNSQQEPGKYSGIGLIDVAGMTVSANRCLDDQPNPTQAYGIEEAGNSNKNLIIANHCRGNLIGSIRAVGSETKCDQNLE